MFICINDANCSGRKEIAIPGMLHNASGLFKNRIGKANVANSS